MVIVESIVATIVSLFVSKGIQDIETKNKSNGNTVISCQGKTLAEIKPERGILSPLERIKDVITTNSQKQIQPDLEYLNNLDRDQKIFGLSLSPDTGFKTKGHLIILLNERIFMEISAGDLNVSAIDLRIPNQGLHFNQGSKLQFFIYNEVDATQISIRIELLTGV